MRKLVVLVTLAMGAVLAFEVLDISDAEARKRRPPAPPNYNFVLCPANTTVCFGTLGADLLVDAAGGGFVQGGPGRDIYVATGGPNSDMYWDRSTSSDLYGGFENGQFPTKIIWDEGGIDRLDLSMITSAYASTDFAFVKADVDSDGKQDDLRILEANVDYGADDEIRVIAHFGSGRMEYIKFTDKTLSGASLPLTP